MAKNTAREPKTENAPAVKTENAPAVKTEGEPLVPDPNALPPEVVRAAALAEEARKRGLSDAPAKPNPNADAASLAALEAETRAGLGEDDGTPQPNPDSPEARTETARLARIEQKCRQLAEMALGDEDLTRSQRQSLREEHGRLKSLDPAQLEGSSVELALYALLEKLAERNYEPLGWRAKREDNDRKLIEAQAARDQRGRDLVSRFFGGRL